jgi:hypothetical protein
MSRDECALVPAAAKGGVLLWCRRREGWGKNPPDPFFSFSEFGVEASKLRSEALVKFIMGHNGLNPQSQAGLETDSRLHSHASKNSEKEEGVEGILPRPSSEIQISTNPYISGATPPNLKPDKPFRSHTREN